MSLRKSPYHRSHWPANDCGVVKKTPSATSLFGGGKQKSETIAGDHCGDDLKSRGLRGSSRFYSPWRKLS
jgi:hypothetical protein